MKMQIPSMSGYATEVGWEPLLLALHYELLAVVPEYEARDVKEKFGVLRVYISYGPNTNKKARAEADRLIAEAEQKSGTICEYCGAPGEIRDEHFWLKTRCDACEEARFGRKKGDVS